MRKEEQEMVENKTKEEGCQRGGRVGEGKGEGIREMRSRWRRRTGIKRKDKREKEEKEK